MCSVLDSPCEEKGTELELTLEILKMSERGVKSCLPFVTLLDGNEVVCVLKIQLSEHGGFGERLKS